jgi:hypothetical protein
MMPIRALLLAASTLVASVFLGASPARADSGSGGPETISVTIPPAGAVSCTRDGENLPKNSTVHHGDRLHCVATGFAANEEVAVALHSPVGAIATVTADSSGRVAYDYSVTQDLAAGAHSLSFTGERSTTVAIYPFVVAVGHSAAGGGSGGGAGGGGSIAFTGLNVLGLLAAALALIAAGVTLHRRRPQREHA